MVGSQIFRRLYKVDINNYSHRSVVNVTLIIVPSLFMQFLSACAHRIVALIANNMSVIYLCLYTILTRVAAHTTKIFICINHYHIYILLFVNRLSRFWTTGLTGRLRTECVYLLVNDFIQGDTPFTVTLF